MRILLKNGFIGFVWLGGADRRRLSIFDGLRGLLGFGLVDEWRRSVGDVLLVNVLKDKLFSWRIAHLETLETRRGLEVTHC